MRGVAVFQINNFDRQIKNDFKALCAKSGYTLTQGILLMMQKAIDYQSLDLKAPQENLTYPAQPWQTETTSQPCPSFRLRRKEDKMKFRIHMHSEPGMRKYCKGYIDVDAPTIHQAVSRATKRLYTGAFPKRLTGSRIVDDVKINKLEFEAEESRSS